MKNTNLPKKFCESPPRKQTNKQQNETTKGQKSFKALSLLRGILFYPLSFSNKESEERLFYE